MTKPKFVLERGRWYGWSMYPGYSDMPYYSPIRVDAVAPLGNGLIEIAFLNAGYAEGVQQMKKKFRVHRRGERHLVLDELHVPERTVIIEPLTTEWIAGRTPWFAGQMAELQSQ